MENKLRLGCSDCLRKHIAQALCRLLKYQKSYKEFTLDFDIAMGHLGEAIDECYERYPSLASAIFSEIFLSYKNELLFYMPDIQVLMSSAKEFSLLESEDSLTQENGKCEIDIKNFDRYSKQNRLFFVRLHLAQAMVCLLEYQKDPEMFELWFDFAMGHMAEAEDESIGEWPELAFAIREERTRMLQEDDFYPDFITLLTAAKELALVKSEEIAKKSKKK